MATQAQIIANRRNAQRSTGPLTPSGKAVASQNSLKHALLARRNIITTESQEEFDHHRDALLKELNPQTPMESMLADRIVSLSWRLKRADLTQNQAIDTLLQRSSSDPLAKLAKSFGLKGLGLPQPDPADSNPDLILGRIALKDFSNARVLDRLLMYERRIEHSLYKTMLELQRLHLLRNLAPPEPNLEPEDPHSAPAPLLAVTTDQTKTPKPPQTQTYPIPAPRDSVRDTLHTPPDMQNEPNSNTAKMSQTPYNPSTYNQAAHSPRQQNEPNRTQFIAPKPVTQPERTPSTPRNTQYKPLFHRQISPLQTREKKLQSTSHSCEMENPPLAEQESKILEKQC